MALGLYRLNFSGNIGSQNKSIQVGDRVYYTPVLPAGSGSTFDRSNGTIILFGLVFSIGPDYIDVQYEGSGGPTLPSPNDYIMFSKNPEVNTSSLEGYYMEMDFVNNSTKPAELFSVGSEVSENSK
tara:strand:- start:1074 stop:1451 length:378 start_codon:yes stop_codon:yes gene_type:complete